MFRSKFSWIGVAAFFIVLLCMPLGHAAMILMEHYFAGGLLNLMAFLLGIVGLGLTVWGMCMKNDYAATLLGFFGGLLVWTLNLIEINGLVKDLLSIHLLCTRSLH